MNKIIRDIESARMTRKVPDFAPGDTVLVQVKVVEGDRERVQAYEGMRDRQAQPGLQFLVHSAQGLARRGRRTRVQTYSPSISEIHGRSAAAHVRRAKLYYLRDLSGKAARIEEKV